MIRYLFLVGFLFNTLLASAQSSVRWTDDGAGYLTLKSDGLVQTDMATGKTTVIFTKEQLINPATNKPLSAASYALSPDGSTMLVFTNTARVWRDNTRGDYYVVQPERKLVRQIGKDKPAQSLMFAKLSPDGKSVGYVSGNNLFVEDVATGKTTQLTTDGTRKRINGTFDWAYEEEFGTQDGFRWSPDSKQIAYWQVDATKIRDYLMLNTTDSIYSFTIPVEYPKVGESPSPTRIGVVRASGGATTWLPIPGDSQQHYLVRMEWTPSRSAGAEDAPELIVEQLNRKQNQSIVFICP
ncbi:MAG: DPP IV N-terminal domain-containing protein, partial [Spirosoma sp.]|nr:DPP IV N-terminal domain-containing protein [Spirosoma sp.]